MPETKIFLAQYFFEGRWWCIEFHASNHEEAERRLEAISGGKVDGELVASFEMTDSELHAIRAALGKGSAMKVH